MIPASVYVLTTAVAGVLLIISAIGLAVWKARKLIPAGGRISLLTFVVTGSIEVVFVFIGWMMLTQALEETRPRVVIGLPIDLCTSTLLAQQRADGGVSNTARAFIRGLNSIGEKDIIDQNTIDALVNPLAQDGNLRQALRAATLRSFLPSADIDLWCRVDQGKLDRASLSPQQKNMLNRVQSLLEAQLP